VGALAKPVWKFPGTLEGRIQPLNSNPCGAGGYYYYPYWYTIPSYYYYSADEHVFCLGTDEEPMPEYRFQPGDSLSVEQAFTPTGNPRLLSFCWHMRHPALPVSRNIVSGGEVSFLNGGLISRPSASWPAGTARFIDGSTDGSKGILVHGVPLSVFTSADWEQLVTVSGAVVPGNNGVKRICSVPMDHGVVTGGDRIGIDSALTESLNDPGVTLRVHGLRWTARVYFDVGGGWVEYLSHSETPGHTAFRGNLAMNLSKLGGGSIEVKFEMKLEVLS